MRYLILHINCPDQRGIIAQFTGILYDHGANVLNLEQHVEPDEKLFFMRIYTDLKNMEISENALNEILQAQVKKMDANIQFYYPENLQKMAIFVTKESAPLYDLLIKHRSGELSCEIPCIVSNHEELGEIAKQFHIPFHHFPITKENKQAQEQEIRTLMQNENIDVINYTNNLQLFISRSLNPAKITSMKIDEENKRVEVILNPEEVSKAIGRGGHNIRLAGKITGYEIDVFRDGVEEDVELTEFSDEIESWVIEELAKAGLDTAKSVLEQDAADLVKRTDLEEETINDVIKILKEEFED